MDVMWFDFDVYDIASFGDVICAVSGIVDGNKIVESINNSIKERRVGGDVEVWGAAGRHGVWFLVVGGEIMIC